MRSIDKLQNMIKANILAEQRFRESSSLNTIREFETPSGDKSGNDVVNDELKKFLIGKKFQGSTINAAGELSEILKKIVGFDGLGSYDIKHDYISVYFNIFNREVAYNIYFTHEGGYSKISNIAVDKDLTNYMNTPD